MIAVVLTTDMGTISATYHGGPYIDIRYGENETPEDLINVFDYGTNKPRIENTTEQVQKTLIEWLKEKNPELSIYSIFVSDTKW